jgi:hypothetical protein
MTTFPRSPRLLKGGIVLIDPVTGIVQRIIALQYNPHTLTRTLQVRGTGDEGDQSEALRLTGPPTETYKLEAEIDAADQLEKPDQNQIVVENGILPQLAALETIIYPKSSRLVANDGLAAQGTLEIVPAEAPLTLFVWSKDRVLPVRLTDFSVTEEAFNPNLHPIRAKVSLGMRVLNPNDLGFGHRGANLFLNYHKQLENFASKSIGGALGDFGLTGIE